MSNEAEDSTPVPPEPSVVAPNYGLPVEARLSAPVLRVAVLLGLSAIVWQTWWHYSDGPMDRLYYPAASATRLIDRVMDYASVFESAHPSERFLQWMQGYSASLASDDALEICAETIEYLREEDFSTDEMTRLQAVLLGESGRTNEMADVVAQLQGTRQDTNFTRLLRAAYLGGPVGSNTMNAFAGDPQLSSEWARDALAMKLAGTLGRRDDLRAAVHRLRERARSTLVRVQPLSALYLLGICTGLGWVLWSIKRFGFRTSASVPLVSSGWAASDAIGVLLYVEAISVAYWYWMPALPVPFLQTISSHCYLLLPAIAASVIVHEVLLRPRQLRFLEHFGFSGRRETLKLALGGGLALFALEFVGSTGLVSLMESAGFDSHWAEDFDEYIVFGTATERWFALLNISMIGPFFEELVMRGVLFATLRRRGGFLLAAIVSSAVFAGLHFYSLPGFVSVMWFGLAACWIYERTRSLLPCVVGHSMVNLFLGWFDLAALG
jgi:membrane protease YdiL (CAAX protease family)